MRKRVPDDVKREIVARYLQGDMVATIAGENGVSKKTVRNIVRAAGIPRRRQHIPRKVFQGARDAIVTRYTRGDVVLQIASDLGLSTVSVQKVVTEAGIPKRKRMSTERGDDPTPAEIEAEKEKIRKGWSADTRRKRAGRRASVPLEVQQVLLHYTRNLFPVFASRPD